MEPWKPQGPTCKDCLNTLDEKPSYPNCGTMITPNGHSTPLKNPQNLTAGCNGNLLLKNGHPKTHIIKSHINDSHSKTGHLEKTNHLNLVKDSLCCFKQSQSSLKKQQEDEYIENENSCGLFSIKPKWMQPLANKKVFLAVFCLTSVLQGMYYTYFVSVLTTIEKLYQIQSKTTGLIMSATEVGQIGGALLLTYYGGQGHRPKWIACGMLVFAAASIFCATPHFLYSELTPKSTSAENYTAATLKELRTKLCHNDSSRTSASSLQLPSNIPTDTNFLDDVIGHDSKLKYNRSMWATSSELASENSSIPSLPSAEAWIKNKDKCEDKHNVSTHTKTTNTVLIIFFASLLLIGIGATAVYTLGIPYIDDNVATRESPLYFGITIGVRIFGPVFGFLLGSFCTSIHVNFPFETTQLLTDNPNWLGAWWLGVLIVGAALILTSFPMMAFPRELPRPCNHDNHSSPKKLRQSISEGELLKCNGNINGVSPECHNCQLCPQSHFYSNRSEDLSKPSLRDFPSALKRLLKNEILLYRTASSVLHILPIAGLYTFLPKYLESQFRLTATVANMISGIAGILVMGIGIFASGTYMRKYKPNARFVARWIAMCALLYAIGMLILMMFGCPINSYVGLNVKSEYEVSTHETCNETCNCQSEFFPICTSEGVTYLSPCLAGCTEVSGPVKQKYVYENCMCLGPNVTAVSGYCPLQCQNLFPYVLVFAIFVLIHSTSEVGSMLLTLRCVEPKDKAMALGLIAFAIGLFGNVPCPIIYGAVVDSACLFWEDNCGEPGACRLYDPSKFRTVFHGVTAVIMLMAFCVDIIVWYKAKAIQFQDDEPSGDEEETVPFNEALNNPQRESSV